MPSNQSFEIRIMYKITIILIIYESNYHIWKDSNCSYTVYIHDILLNRLQAIPASRLINYILLIINRTWTYCLFPLFFTCDDY